MPVVSEQHFRARLVQRRRGALGAGHLVEHTHHGRGSATDEARPCDPVQIRCERSRLRRSTGRRASHVDAVDTQRLGQLAAVQLLQIPTGDGFGQPSHQPANRQSVVGRLAEISIDRSRGQAIGHQIRIEHLLVVVRNAGKPRQTRGVRENPIDRDRFLAVGGKLRPVPRHRRAVVQQSTIHQTVNDRRGHSLGRREDHRSGITSPLLTLLRHPSPQVEHGLTIHVHARGAPTHAITGEGEREDAHYSAELGARPTVHSRR
ncbi:Uncharacterised protein [Mycobacteroides abscessus subsp. abscessus]|nr:Uncharacterised protein [Mycobacteroides abscessus subsp. abscessus]SLJ79633.1 Uncharacterised protein [Mycobacteroides abscessus subsp. abscessus]SLJ79730.1 Uncharacterised protein [Mycobacteroides abscessus subsp. abscessus]